MEQSTATVTQVHGLHAVTARRTTPGLNRQSARTEVQVNWHIVAPKHSVAAIRKISSRTSFVEPQLLTAVVLDPMHEDTPIKVVKEQLLG